MGAGLASAPGPRTLTRRLPFAIPVQDSFTINLKASLRAIVLGATCRIAADECQLDEVAGMLARILPLYVKAPHVGRYFDLWQGHGFHLTPVHYYQPIPDTRTLGDEFWSTDSQLAGLDMNEASQLKLLGEVFPLFRNDYSAVPETSTGRPYQYYLNNQSFGGTDALVLCCMVRHFKPRLILEVGGGFSTRLSAQAELVNGDTRLVCRDPYPDETLAAGFPGLVELIPGKPEAVALDLFQELQAGDILFIDSCHVVRSVGDVNFLFLEVLPRLKPGVVVHVHDVFLPRHYPRQWTLQWHTFWPEEYLLQAFLAFNSAFEVLFANACMGLRHSQEMRLTNPKSPWWCGGSFWMRRKLQ